MKRAWYDSKKKTRGFVKKRKKRKGGKDSIYIL